MGRQIRRVSIALALLAALLLPPFLVEACGPDLSPPNFTYSDSPDVPLDAFATGRLGVLQPGYHHLYLYLAYRNLTGKPLDAVELAALKTNLRPGLIENPRSPANWIQAWIAARRAVLGNGDVNRYGYYDENGITRSVQAPGEYYSYYNCLSAAFENAVGILHDRVAEFGASSAYVQQWLAAQDEVFDNCSGGSLYPPRPAVAEIPAAAPSSDPPAMREDRAYQIASAHFYAGEFEQARAGFEAIAQDPASPYGRMAPYLVARVLVREGTLGNGTGATDDAALEKAAAQLRAVLADPRQAEYHHAASGLLEYISLRLHPREREGELEAALTSGKPDDDYRQNVIDYLWLLDKPSHPPASRATAPAGAEPESGSSSARGDMSEWILSFGGTGDAAFEHSFSRWQQTRSSPWLLAALMQAQGNSPQASELMAAASEVKPDSPAYLTLTFHRLRLLAAAGQAGLARDGADRVLADAALGLGPGARNQFLALRMSLSTSLRDWLRYADRVPLDLGIVSYFPQAQTAPMAAQPLFDSDASVVLTEKLPLTMLADAARSPSLPPSQREEVAIAGWTRAILLNDAAAERRFTPLLASLAPELRKSLAAYESEKTTAGRDFAAAFLLLHFPGMRPFVPAGIPRTGFPSGPEKLAQLDLLRDNWWCSMGPGPQKGLWVTNYYTMYIPPSPSLREVYPDGKVPSPLFLSEPERAQAAREWAELQTLPTAPDWMGNVTLDWARAHPGDPRIPEALFLVVHATRYGCVDAGTSAYSRRAFNLLHARYPGSSWAKKTLYWFK